MTISLVCETDWPTLEGRQRPEHLLCDEGDQVEADKAVALATRVGKAQFPWQEDTLRGLLALTGDGLFTHPTGIIIACRQNGKTLSAAELRILFGAFQRRETIVYSAQRWLTAKSIYLRLKRLISSRPSLKRRAFGWLCSQGVAGFSVRHDDGTENTVMFITRSGDFRGPDEIDLVVYDEAYNLTDNAMAAISPTQLASKNPQTIYLSSAVNEEIHANGEVLARLRYRALKAIAAGRKGMGLYYAEYMAPEPPVTCSDEERRAVREDPATWKLANPSYGVIQTEAKVRKLLTELSPTDFEVEILGWGRWPVDEESRRALIDPRKWRGFAVTDPNLVGPRALVLDRSLDRAVWIMCAAQRTAEGRIYLEFGYSQAASNLTVVKHAKAVAVALNPITLVIDAKSDAAVLKPDLIEAGIEPTITNTTEFGIACGGFLDDALDGRLAHGNQVVFSTAVAGAAMRELPGGGFVWSAEADKRTFAYLRAASLARWALLEFGPVKRQMAEPISAATGSNGHQADDFDAMTAAF